jgi:hypothetical protein
LIGPSIPTVPLTLETLGKFVTMTLRASWAMDGDWGERMNARDATRRTATRASFFIMEVSRLKRYPE